MATFIITLVATAVTTIILSIIYYKYWHEIDKNVKADNNRVQENSQIILIGKSVKVGDPSYATTQFDRDTTHMDTNQADAVTD